MATRAARAPRTALRPLRVGPITHGRLERQAREDSTAGTTGTRFDDDRADASTPTVQAIQAHANAYARREEQRFFSRVHHELGEYRVLAGALEADRLDYDQKTADFTVNELDAIADGQGASFEDLRRLQRRIRRGTHRIEELHALLDARFTAAKLRANRYYDHSDEKIAIYWGAYRRSRSADRPGERAPLLRRSDWLTTKENTRLLELLQGRTDAQT